MLITSYGKYTQPIGKKKKKKTQKRILIGFRNQKMVDSFRNKLGNKKFFSSLLDNKIPIFFEGEKRMFSRITSIELKYKASIGNQIHQF